eukprot:TRINITY_DN108617_c0_g1_i1.p1 TRINITY_DN108617_c0_g1~~TRINITY_DN108617_c0_g1_i1.p1  ORF type:complete len:263 (-),score=36.53 TRINITY_DN108617_c0_g1_i1:106-894(-)
MANNASPGLSDYLQRKFHSILDADISELRSSLDSRSTALRTPRKYETLRNAIAEVRNSPMNESIRKLKASVPDSTKNIKETLGDLQRKLSEVSLKLEGRNDSLHKRHHKTDQELEEIVFKPHQKLVAKGKVEVKKKSQQRKRSASLRDSLMRSKSLKDRYVGTKERQEELLTEVFKERRIGHELHKKLSKLLKKVKNEPRKELEKLQNEYKMLKISFDKSEKVRLQQKKEIEQLQKTLEAIREHKQVPKKFKRQKEANSWQF